MRKKITTVFCLFLAFIITNVHGSSKSWYKFYKGKIGDYPVTFHLNRYDDNIGGYYYYDKYMVPLVVSGSFTGDSLNLSAYLISYKGEYFNGIFKSGLYSGEWGTDDSEKKLNFRIEEDKELSSLFDYVFVNDEKKLIKNFNNSPAAAYFEASVWPTERNPDKERLRYILCSEQNAPTDLTNITTQFYKNQQEFFDGFFKDNKDLTKKQLENIEMAVSYNLEINSHLQIVYIDENILVTSAYSWSYTGGAHGNYATWYGVYDLKTKKRLKVPDVFTEDGIDTFTGLLEKNYRKQNNVADSVKLDQELAVDTIPVTDDFFVTPGCVMFDYPPYQISAYAAGEIRIYIQMEEVKNYLTPLGASLLRKKI